MSGPGEFPREPNIPNTPQCLGGGAWPFLVGGVICLVNSVNERDLNLLTSYAVLERRPTRGNSPGPDMARIDRLRALS